VLTNTFQLAFDDQGRFTFELLKDETETFENDSSVSTRKSFSSYKFASRFAPTAPLPIQRDNVKPHVQLFWEIQNERCYFCGKLVPLSHSTIDHKMPKTKLNQSIQHKLSKSFYSNLVMSCFLCNNEKSFRSTFEYRKFKALAAKKKYTQYFFFADTYRDSFQCDTSILKGNPSEFYKNNNNVVIQKILALY
jgi:hypothetical protein